MRRSGAVITMLAVATSACSYTTSPVAAPDQPTSTSTTVAAEAAREVLADGTPESAVPLVVGWYAFDERLPVPVPEPEPPDRTDISLLEIGDLEIVPAPSSVLTLVEAPPRGVTRASLQVTDPRAAEARFVFDVFTGSRADIDRVQEVIGASTDSSLIVAQRTAQVLAIAPVTERNTAADNQPFLEAIVSELTSIGACGSCDRDPPPSSRLLWSGVGPSPSPPSGLQLIRVPDADFRAAGSEQGSTWWLDDGALIEARRDEWTTAATDFEAADSDGGIYAWVRGNELHLGSGWGPEASTRNWAIPEERQVTDLSLVAGTIGDGDVLAMRSVDASGHRWDVFAIDDARQTGDTALVRVGGAATEQVRWTRGGWWAVDGETRLVVLGGDGAPGAEVLSSDHPITSWDLDRSGRLLVVTLDAPDAPSTWLIVDGAEPVELELDARFVRWVD